MGYQRLTTSEVEAATRHLPGGAARARLLEEKDRLPGVPLSRSRAHV